MRTTNLLLVIALLSLAGCDWAWAPAQRDPIDRTRHSDCVPLPSTPTPDRRPRTPTPNLTQAADPAYPTPAWVTMTPKPFVHRIDLSPAVKNEDKMIVVVYRCNGTWDQYAVAPAAYPTAIPLARGDIIYDAIPPISMMRQPPTPVTPSAPPR